MSIECEERETIEVKTRTETANATERRVFVVLNPVAGEGNGKQLKGRLSDYWPFAHTIHETKEGESLAQVVADAVDDGYEMVAAVGGDGTVSEVADGLVNKETPLIIIPAGTGNALAEELGIPRQMEDACRLVTEDFSIRKLDGVCIEDKCFFLQVGVGLESVTMKETSRQAKNNLGSLAYVGTAVREAVGWQPHHFDLQIDGESHSLRAAELVVANSATLGLMSIEWGEHISPDDGVVHLGAIKAKSILGYGRSLIAMIRGETRQTPLIRYFEARESLRIASDQALPVHGDGETIGETPFSAQIVPGALQVVIPSKEAGQRERE